MKIRKANPNDAKDIKSAHYYAYQKNYRGYLPDVFLDNMPFDEAVIIRTANDIKEHEYYVVEKEGKVIGFASCEYPFDKTVEIMAIYIHPDFQRCGAGSALMHEISHIKKEQGYTKLILWTIKDGPSLGFYEKHHMKQSEDIEEKMWKLNIPIICLEKDL